jgi:hypothetical protein
MNLLKSSAVVEKSLHCLQRRRFFLGIFLTTVFNTTLDTFAFSFLSVSVIAPFGGLCIVTSAMLAHKGVFGPKETLDRTQWVFLLSIFCGVGLVGGFGPRPPPVTNATAIFEDFDNVGFICYQSVWIIITASAYTGLHVLKMFEKNSLWTTVLFGSSAGMSSGITQCIMKAITSISAGAAIMHGVEHAWVYFPWSNPQFWRAVVELIVAALLLLHGMNTCICSTDVGISTAMYQSALIVGSVLAGCAFWGDLDGMTPLSLSMFMIGLVGVVAGVCLLLTRHKNNQSKTISKPTSTTVELEGVESHSMNKYDQFDRNEDIPANVV